MRVIAMLARSAGNESVGSMWTDTKSFPLDAPISEIMEWAAKEIDYRSEGPVPIRETLTLQIDQNEDPSHD